MDKICTTIEQSKKLIELEIDVKTADMIYQPIMDIDSMNNVGFDKTPLCFPFNEVKECNIQYLPAWSFTALINVLPQGTRLLKSATDEMYHCDCPKGNINKWFDNPVDAAFDMVVYLKENNLL